MNQENQKLNTRHCWEIMQCRESDCPSFGKVDLRCWLQQGTHCFDSVQGEWLEKMELCLSCAVFNDNIQPDDFQDTLKVIAEQFEKYRQSIDEKEKTVQEHQKKLEEFNKTSVYLLRELDQKTEELKNERNQLGERVAEKTEELKKTHEKLMQSQKLAALGRFSAGIAHEINNPLGAIINYVRNLLGNPTIDGQNRGYLELISKGLFRIEYIVRQILSYSGGQNVKTQHADINKILQDALSLLSHRFDQKQIQLETQLADEMPQVFVDQIQIQQVIGNICRNAIDASTKKTKIEVKTWVGEGKVCLSVKDFGCGMTPEVKEKIFDPFYTTKEVGDGTGLGLFLSYNILQIYQGEIHVESEAEKGTVVKICIPY